MADVIDEAAAKVIWHGLNANIPGDYLPFDRLPDPQRGILLATAKQGRLAMLRAMRERGTTAKMREQFYETPPKDVENPLKFADHFFRTLMDAEITELQRTK